MSLKETYNRIARDWHNDHKDDDWWIEGTNKFISLFNPGALVLDVGCAGGIKAHHFVKHGLKVVGIDFSEKMIEIAKQELSLSTFLVLNLDEVNKLEHQFDGIFMQAVLLHIPKKEVEDNLKKANEKLKPGGYFYIAVREKREKGAEEEIVTEDGYGYHYKRFFSYFTVEEIETYLKNLGLKIVISDVTVAGNTRWIQVVGKK